MIGTLLATGLVVVGAGSVLAFAPRTSRPGLVAQALGIAVVGIAGLAVFASGDELGASFTSELEPRFGVDGLSGYFLFVLGLVAAPAVVFATRYLGHDATGRVTAGLEEVRNVTLVAHLLENPAADRLRDVSRRTQDRLEHKPEGLGEPGARPLELGPDELAAGPAGCRRSPPAAAAASRCAMSTAARATAASTS